MIKMMSQQNLSAAYAFVLFCLLKLEETKTVKVFLLFFKYGFCIFLHRNLPTHGVFKRNQKYIFSTLKYIFLHVHTIQFLSKQS